MGALISTLVFQPPVATYSMNRKYTMLATSLHSRIASFYIKHEYGMKLDDKLNIRFKYVCVDVHSIQFYFLMGMLKIWG